MRKPYLLVLICAVCLALPLALFLGGFKDPADIVLLISFVLLSAGCIASVLADVSSGINPLFSIKTYFVAGFFTFVVVDIGKELWVYAVPTAAGLATTVKACLCMGACLAAYHIGYYSFKCARRLSAADAAGNAPPSVRMKRVIFFTAVYGIIGMIGFVFYSNPYSEAQEIFARDYSNYQRMLSYFAFASAMLVTYMAIGLSKKGSIKLKLVPVFFFLPFVIIGFWTGARGLLIYPVCFVFLYFLYKRHMVGGKPYGLRESIVTGLFLMFVFISFNAVKEMAQRGWVSGRWIQEDTVVRGGNLEFVDTFRQVTQTIQLHADRGDYLYGWTFAAFVVNPLPRAIWPAKPYGYSRLIVDEWYGTDYVPGLSLSTSLTGESIANFGYPGAAVVFFLFGVANRRLWSWFANRPPGSYQHLVYLCLLPAMFMQNRGDFATMSTGALYIIFPFYLALRLSWRKPSMRTSGAVPAVLAAR